MKGTGRPAGGRHDVDREAVLALVKQDSMPGWWADYSDVVPGRFEPFLGLELAASVIRCYEVEFVPGLLQTERYAEAVIRQAHADDTDAQIERRVRPRGGGGRGIDPPPPPPPAGGSVTILRFPEEHLPDVVYLEHVTRALYLDKTTDVEHYWDVMNRLAVQAEPAAA